MATWIRKRFARLGCLLAMMVGTFVSSASAETLMMPNREVVKGTQTVVWGVTTQANGTPYTIDFGDGSAIVSGNVVDRSYVAFNYTYILANSPEITATLTVGTGLSAEIATVKIQTWDPADPLVASQLRNIGINMAIQDGLRYLWVAQSDRANQFPANAMTHWDGSNPNSWTALVTLAFENQGYGIPDGAVSPTGLYQKYIVQRGLNFVINSLGKLTSTAINTGASLPYAYAGYPYNNYPACLTYGAFYCGTIYSAASGSQPAGDPRVGVPNDADLSVILYGEGLDRSAYGTAVAMLPLAASGALNRTVTGIPGSGSGGFVVNRSYREVLQRLSNALVWGQIDSGSGQGGWMYALNPGGSNTIPGSTSGGFASDGSTVGWGVLALLDAEAAGIVVPNFAKTEFQTAYNNGINSDGSFDYNTDSNPTSTGAANIYRNMTRAGVGLEGLYYTGVHGGAAFVGNAPGQAALTFLSDRWAGANSGFGDYTDTCAGPGAGQNKGCAYAMFNIFKGLKLQGVTTLPGSIFRPADATHPANDWYADYQDWLVTNQTSATDKNGGYWGSMRFSCCANDTAPNSALAELVLSPVALVLPDPTKFSTVGLSPLTGTSPTGLTHTLTAHAESSGTPGTPVAGAHVVFKAISGPNTGILGAADTDSTGDATITYTDLGPGTDSIRGFIGSTLASNTVTMTWTVTTVTPTITANNRVYDGTNAASLITCTVSGAVASPPGAPVSCTGAATFSDKNVANGKTVTATGITLTGAGAANYVLSTTTATTTANITPKPASVVPNAYVKTYGQADPAFAATLSGFVAADGITASVSRTAGDTVLGSPYSLTATLSPVAALGNYTITTNTNLLFITPKAAGVSVNAATKIYGSPDPVFTGTFTGFLAADNVTATYSRVAGDTVLGGPYAITATLGPTAVLSNYSIVSFDNSLTITLKTASVTPAAAGKVYGSTDPTLTGTLTGFVPADGVTATYHRTAGETVAGSPYTISATLAPAGVLSNYAVTSNTAAFTISPKPVSVTPDAASKVYGSADPALTGTLTGFLPADGVTATYSRTPGETVLGSPYTISATPAPAAVLGNYAITSNTAAFVITPKPASVTPNDAGKVYGSSDPTLTGTLGGFLVADGVTASYSRTPGESVGASPYTIGAVLSPAGVLGNYAITLNTAAFAISPKTASVTVNAASKPYGASNPTLTGTLAGFLPADGVTASYTRTPGETVLGSPYAITATLGPAAVLGNYTITNTPAAFAITAIAASVTPDAASKVYGTADPTLTGTLGGFLPADLVTASYSRVSGEAVLGGPYTISATLGPVAALSNYVITSNTASFTITLAAASVTPAAAGKTYGSGDPALTGTLVGFVSGDGVTATYSRTAGETVGASPYTITATLAPVGVLSNYAVAYNAAPFAISPKTASVAVAAASKTYGAPEPTLTGTLAGFVPADGVTASYSRTSGETVLGGPYAITATLGPAEVLSNYLITNTPAALTISALAASVTPNAASKTYGAADPTLTGTLAGFLAADGVTASYSRTPSETVVGGPYTISATLAPAAVLSNYAVTYNTAGFTIDALAASVTPNAAGKIYGASDPALTGTLAGFLGADGVTASYSRAAGETVAGGPYTISATLSPSGVLNNYAITYKTAGFSISQATLTVTTPNQSKVYGAPLPALTATVSGQQNGDVITVNTVTTTGTASSAVSSYPISTTLSDPGGKLANYDVVNVGGTLNVTPAVLTITADAKTGPHGNPLPAFSATYTTLLNGDTPASLAGTLSLTSPATTSSPTGTYLINVSGVSSPNYTITFVAGTLTLTNQAPVASNDAYSGQWNAPLVVATGVLVNDTDSNHDPLTAVQASGPAHGTVALNANGSFTYTPSANYFGADSFTYRANDGLTTSNLATVTITITTACPGDGKHNDFDKDDCGKTTAIAKDDGYTTQQGTTLNVAGKGVLANDGNLAITAALVSGPANGTVSLNANGGFSYVPAASFYGTDTYTYAAVNTAGQVGPVATVTIVVKKNVAPDAHNDSYSTPKNVPLTVTGTGVLGNDTDNNGNPLTASIVTGPAHGTITLSPTGGFIYAPVSTFTGTDTFTYKAIDPLGLTDTATVSISVTQHYNGDGDDHDRNRNGHHHGDGCEHDRQS